jgi:hypothetical protein
MQTQTAGGEEDAMTTTPDDGGWYYAEDIARLAGIKIRTVHRSASVTAAMIERGELDPANTRGELPPPEVERVKRTMHTAKGLPRTVWSSRWRKEVIDNWLPQRRGPGGAPADPEAYRKWAEVRGVAPDA